MSRDEAAAAARRDRFERPLAARPCAAGHPPMTTKQEATRACATVCMLWKCEKGEPTLVLSFVYVVLSYILITWCIIDLYRNTCN